MEGSKFSKKFSIVFPTTPGPAALFTQSTEVKALATAVLEASPKKFPEALRAAPPAQTLHQNEWVLSVISIECSNEWYITTGDLITTDGLINSRFVRYLETEA